MAHIDPKCSYGLRVCVVGLEEVGVGAAVDVVFAGPINSESTGCERDTHGIYMVYRSRFTVRLLLARLASFAPRVFQHAVILRSSI